MEKAINENAIFSTLNSLGQNGARKPQIVVYTSAQKEALIHLPDEITGEEVHGIVLVDTAGRNFTAKTQVCNGQINIGLEKLPTGVYFLRFFFRQEAYSARIIKTI